MDTFQEMRSVNQLLQEFGLDEKERQVYVLLLKMDWSTALQISRLSSIKRPTLYRVLDSLLKKGLVEQQLDDKTTYYSAANPKSFESLVIEQEKKTILLQNNLNVLQNRLTVLAQNPSDATSVKFYRGVKGLQTMEWRMCEVPNSETLIFGIAQWDKVLGENFAEEIRSERMKKNIYVREILNEDTIQPITTDGTTTWTQNKQYTKKYFHHRSISREIMDIRNEIMLLPTSIMIYSFSDADPVGIEMVGANYANFMRQLFELSWMQAKAVDEFGGE